MICAFTGHRKLPKEKLNTIVKILELEIDKAIAEGCDHFISGGAPGFDILAARLVTEKIDCDESIKLTLLLPYTNFMSPYELAYFQPYCKEINCLYKGFLMNSYHDRDRKMVDKADKLIAYYDNRGHGGTLYTIKYAQKKGVKISFIDI